MKQQGFTPRIANTLKMNGVFTLVLELAKLNSSAIENLNVSSFNSIAEVADFVHEKIYLKGGENTMIHDNYEKISDEERAHVDAMYNLVNKYAKENGIKLAYNDIAEVFVEALATYITDSK